MQAYIDGDADALVASSVELIWLCGIAPDRCPELVLVLAETRGADQLLVRPGVSSLLELRDQSLAVAPGVLPRYLVTHALKQQQLPAAAAPRLLALPRGEWDQALMQGRLAGVVADATTAADLRRHLPLEPLFSSADLSHEMFVLLAVDRDLLRRSPGAVQALIEAWLVRRRAASGEAMDPHWREPGRQEQYQLLDPRQQNLLPVLRHTRIHLVHAGMVPLNTPLPPSDPAPMLAAYRALASAL